MDFITVKEAAKILGKDPQVLRNDIRNGKSNIPAVYSGSRIYISKEAFFKTLGLEV